MKLTDSHLGLLSRAMQRDDRALDIRASLKDRQKLVGQMLSVRLIEEVPARGALPVWRRDEQAGALGAGCLAAHFELLPWKKKELRTALLNCEQSHIDLVGATSAGRIKEGSIAPLERLRTILRQRTAVADLRTKTSRLAKPSAPIGYIIEHNANTEFLFNEEQFANIAGGKSEAQKLKHQLFSQGHIETASKGKKLRYAVKRTLPGKSKRRYFIVVRGVGIKSNGGWSCFKAPMPNNPQ